MQVADYIGYVASEGDKFATAAGKGDLTVDIEACTGWNMRSLVRHLGLIHLWAAGTVVAAQDDWLDAMDIPDMARYWPELGSSWPDDTELVSWYSATKDNLIRVLESAPADHQCFSFLPAPTPVTMWSRRQASEIAIHRFDAENARGISSHFEPEFAADMLDELLSGFAARPRHPKSAQIESEQVLHVHADDVDEHWYLTIGPRGTETARRGGDADLTVTATATDLYLHMVEPDRRLDPRVQRRRRRHGRLARELSSPLVGGRVAARSTRRPCSGSARTRSARSRVVRSRIASRASPTAG